MWSTQRPRPAEQLNDDVQLGRLLLERQVISPDEYRLVTQQAKAAGRPLWRALVSLNLVSLETLNQLAESIEIEPAHFPESNPISSAPMESPAEQVPPIILSMPSSLSGSLPPLPNPPAPMTPMVLNHSHIATAAAEDDTPELVDQLFHRAMTTRATDIHFDPREGSALQVRFRIDGQLHDVLQLPARLTNGVVSRIKVLANMDIIEKRDAQDGHIVRTINGQQQNLRIATLPTKHGERLVARLLDEKALQLGLDKLGFDLPQVEIVERILRKPYGILIVTGPVGSGKSTTLYSCLQRVRNPHLNVMTIEDPVEYSVPGVNQVQVDPRADWTFPKALRAMLRQDPDVMMIGEVRDEETARIAVRASMTGVLVLTSMHANDAASTIGNLYNFGIGGYLISASLLGVIAQRLVRKINQSCAEEYAPDEKTLRLLQLTHEDSIGVKLKRGRGASADFGTGYLGRTGVFEVMEIDDALREMIFREASKDVVREAALERGMIPLARHAVSKVMAGITTVEEAFRVSVL